MKESYYDKNGNDWYVRRKSKVSTGGFSKSFTVKIMSDKLEQALEIPEAQWLAEIESGKYTTEIQRTEPEAKAPKVKAEPTPAPESKDE